MRPDMPLVVIVTGVFYYYGAEDYLHRAPGGREPAAWDNYLHLRDNVAGVVRDLWYHEAGCSQWLVVTRNTVTHEIRASNW